MSHWSQEYDRNFIPTRGRARGGNWFRPDGFRPGANGRGGVPHGNPYRDQYGYAGGYDTSREPFPDEVNVQFRNRPGDHSTPHRLFGRGYRSEGHRGGGQNRRSDDRQSKSDQKKAPDKDLGNTYQFQFPRDVPTNQKEREEASRVCSKFLLDASNLLGASELKRMMNSTLFSDIGNSESQDKGKSQAESTPDEKLSSEKGKSGLSKDAVVFGDDKNTSSTFGGVSEVEVLYCNRTEDTRRGQSSGNTKQTLGVEHKHTNGKEQGIFDTNNKQGRSAHDDREESTKADSHLSREEVEKLLDGYTEDDEGKSNDKSKKESSKVADIATELVFSCQEEFDEETKRRIRELRSEGEEVIPAQLLDWKVSQFKDIEGYDMYIKDVIKAITAVRPLVLSKTRTAGGDYRHNWPSSQDSDKPTHYKKVDPKIDPKVDPRTGDIPPVSHPDDRNSSGKDKKVLFTSTPPDKQGENTPGLTSGGRVDRTQRGEAHSTPYGTGEGQEHRGMDESAYSNIPHHTDQDTYNIYNIPAQFRRREERSSGNPGNPQLSSTLGGAGDQASTGSNGVTNLPAMQSVMAAVPTGHVLDMFSVFEGQNSKYPEWKSTTQTLLNNIPADMRPILLKKLLRSKEQAKVSYISHKDPTAVEDIWRTLDTQFGCSIEQADYHMSRLQRWIRDGARCNDYESLQHLFDFLKEHYYGIVRQGATKVGMAEAIGYGITPLLFGKSQREVNRLRYGNETFNMHKVFEIMERHLADLKRQESDKDKLSAESTDALLRDYSENDLPYLRRGIVDDRNLNKSKQYYNKDKYHKGYYQDYRSFSRDRYRKDSRERQRDDSRGKYKENYRDKYREDSRSKYRENSRDKYREDSRGKYRENSRGRYGEDFRDSDRSESRSRNYSKDRQYYRDGSRNDYNYRRGQTQDRYDTDRYRQDSKDRFKRDSSDQRGRSREREERPQVLASSGKVEETTVQSTYKGKRGRDPTPGPRGGRGSLSRSPVSQRRDRPYNSFKCTLCLADDHDSFDCLKHSAQDVYSICNERRLCYKCFLTGHGSMNCKVEKQCSDNKCKTDMKHHTKLCDRFRRD